MNSWDLKGKRALVMGGSKGIGKAIVDEFLSLGAEVLFTARHADEVAFLAMDKSSYITGQNLSVDGGVTCRLL